MVKIINKFGLYSISQISKRFDKVKKVMFGMNIKDIKDNNMSIRFFQYVGFIVYINK